MKIPLSRMLSGILVCIEKIADRIYLSSEADEATRKAYIEGKAKLAEAQTEPEE